MPVVFLALPVTVVFALFPEASRFVGLGVVEAGTDGTTATVTLAAVVPLPLINVVSGHYSDGYPIRGRPPPPATDQRLGAIKATPRFRGLQGALMPVPTTCIDAVCDPEP